MANRRRGEVEATIDGRPRVLCLTLGALCELETAFAVDDLASLAERFASGRLKARDVARVFAAGLSGGGTPTTEAEVLALRIDGGLVGAAAVVADLLAVTFGADERVDEGGRGRGDPVGEGSPSPRSVPGAVEPPSPGTT